MANNRSIANRRPTFLIDDILRAKDFAATRVCETSRTATAAEARTAGIESSNDDVRECDVERRRDEKLDSASFRSGASSAEVTSPVSTGHCSQSIREVISLRASKSSDGGANHREQVATRNDSRNDHNSSAENLAKRDGRDTTNTTAIDEDDDDVNISRMTYGEFKPKAVTDSRLQSRGRSSDDNHILKLLSAVGYAPTSRLNGSTDCDGFESTAAAAGTLYRLCHMHLTDSQQVQRRSHHQSTAIPLLADRPQLPVDNRLEQHHGHEHWASSLRRAILHASIDTEMSRTTCLDRQNSPYLYRQNTQLSSHISFPLLNYARSASGVLSAGVGGCGGRLPTVAATGGAGIPDGEFLRMKCRRNRTVFTEYHLTSLEKNFDRQKYLSTKDRAQLAARLGLSQIQVKTWYQNRRMKWKKQVLQQGGTHPPTKPKGRPRKHEDEQNANQQLMGNRMDTI